MECAGQPRPQLDCSSEIRYQGVNTEGGGSILKLGSVNAKYEQTALRRVNEQVEQYVAMHQRLCRDYNSCVLATEEYKEKTADIQRLMLPVSSAVAALETTENYGDRKKIFADLYTAVVPAEDRREELTFRMLLEAELPAAAGNGRVQVKPGAPLPTNARVAFTFEVSRQAFLYVFQRAPGGEPTVLFPDPRIGTTNPLPGGQARRIPPGDQHFRLNEKDVGRELVYVVVSGKPLANLDLALQRVANGQVTHVSQDQSLAALTTVAPGYAGAGCTARALELGGTAPPCTRSRGLVLDQPALAESQASIVVRTEPGDDVIVKAFPFEHVAEGAYATAVAAYSAETPEGRRLRGVVDETAAAAR